MYYNEENEKNSKSLIISLLLRILLIIAIIFILVWLFPTKNSLNPLYNEIFRNNVDSMKEAAETYFTNERLPKNVGDKVRLTLQEMLDKKLLLPFVDRYDKSCDPNASYVEITKTETEYELKVNLVCSKEEAYVIEHLGCTDKCVDCKPQKPEKTDNSSNQTRPTVTEYEFQKNISKKELIGYECSKGYTLKNKLCVKTITITDTKDATAKYEDKTTIVNAIKKEENTTKYLYKYGKQITTTKEIADTSKPIRHYTYDDIIGYSSRKVCSAYNYFIDKKTSTLYRVGSWDKGTEVTMDYVPDDTATTRYEVVGMNYDKCNNSCTLKPYFIVKVYKRTAIQETRTEQELRVECQVSEKQVPIYGLKITFEGFVKDRVTTTEKVYEWSESKNDQKLIKQNFGYLGIKKANGTETKVTYTCPTGTTVKPNDKTKCTKTEKIITGYTCPTDYKLNDKKCTKTTKQNETKNATAKYKTVNGIEFTWSTSKSLKGWTATGRTRKVTK